MRAVENGKDLRGRVVSTSGMGDTFSHLAAHVGFDVWGVEWGEKLSCAGNVLENDDALVTHGL